MGFKRGNTVFKDTGKILRNFQDQKHLTDLSIFASTLSPSLFQKSLGSVYTGPDPLRVGRKLVWISLAFTRDLVDPVWIGSVICYQMGPLMKLIPYGTVPIQFRIGPVQSEWISTKVDPIPNGSAHIRSHVNVALFSSSCKTSRNTGTSHR